MMGVTRGIRVGICGLGLEFGVFGAEGWSLEIGGFRVWGLGNPMVLGTARGSM